MKSTVLCDNCEGNGFLYNETIRSVCIECGGFGFNNDKSQQDKVEEKFYLIENNEVDNFDESFDDGVPPPPPEITSEDKKHIKMEQGKKLLSFKDHKRNSVWKYHEMRYVMVMHCLKIFKRFNELVSKHAFTHQLFYKDCTKGMNDIRTEFEKMKSEIVKYSAITSINNFIDIELDSNVKYICEIEHLKKEILENNTFIDQCKNKLGSIKKREEEETKKVESIYKTYQKQHEKCKSLIKKTCSYIANMNKPEAIEKSKRGSSSKIDKKYVKLKLNTRINCETYQTIITNLNETMENLYEKFYIESLESLDEIEISINSKIENLLNQMIKMEQNNATIKSEDLEKMISDVKSITVVQDTAKYSKRIEDFEEIKREYAVKYDLELRSTSTF